MRLARAIDGLLALGGVLLLTASAHGQPNDAAQRLTPPPLDVEALHERWEETVLRAGSQCAWPTYRVDARATGDSRTSGVLVFRSLRSALADAAATADVCGPTIQLASGRHDTGLFEITKPTILRGAPGAVVVGTLANVSDAPMWIQDVSFVNAPFPGALIAAHRDSDLTLIRVAVRGARGFGIVQYGGRLETWGTAVVGTRQATAEEFRRLDTLLPQQRALTREPVTRRAFPLVDRLADMFSERGRFGPGAHALVAAFERANTEVWAPLLWSTPLKLQCSGSGQLLITTMAELHQQTFAGNSAAGLVVSEWSLVAGDTISAPFNGYGVSIPDPIEAIASQTCVGGIDVRGSVLLVDGIGTFANNEVGVLADDATVGIGNGTLTSTQSTSGTWGDNLTATYDAYLAVSSSASSFAVRAGILYAASLGNVINSSSTQNRYGIAINNSQVYMEAFDTSGNSELPILTDGNLPIPNEPLDVPDAP